MNLQNRPLRSTTSQQYFGPNAYSRELKLDSVTWEQAGVYHCEACDFKTNCYKSNLVTINIHREYR
jgi:hypothetical protein